ncbi:MAG: RNA polymerase sigma factor [Polyangiaceae bacterium]|nr:RNA polymerase sigma factor [Polyangiaceae bacterium]
MAEECADDLALVTLLRQGDRAAFRTFVDRFHHPMLRLARAMAGSSAEDVVQETWAAVIDGIDRFEHRSSLRTWIFRILTNRASTAAKRSRRLELAGSLAEELAADDPAVDPQRFTRRGNWAQAPASWNERTPEDILARAETGAEITRLIEALPTAQRVVVTLRDVDGLDSAEVCEILGITEANQRVLLHRGRSKLRSALEAFLSSEGAA